MLLVVNSAVTEVSELKNICIAIFKFFECKFLTFITLNPSAKTRSIFKTKCQIESMKKICLAFVTN